MKAFLSSIAISLCLVGFKAHATPTGNAVTVTTFNLKWFGLGGNMWNTPDAEFRLKPLKKFIEQELKTTDVFIFTEIIDANLLTQIISKKIKCSTYDREQSPKHQKIVACYNSQKFRLEKYDEDYEIPEVNLGRHMLRPALQVKLCLRKGPCVFQLLGLHLLAGKKSKERLEQVQALTTELTKQHNPLPTIIAGDLNSHAASTAQGGSSDIDLFEEELASSGRNFHSVNRGIKTFGSGERSETLDHILVDQNIRTINVRGYEACQVKQDLNRKFIPYFSFRRYYSDHCPVSATFKIPVQARKIQ